MHNKIFEEFNQNWGENYEKSILHKISHNKLSFFNAKFELGMFSAFIWYTYCPYRSEMTNFQKSSYWKLANFRDQIRLIWCHLMAKLYNMKWCSNTLQVDKDASFHLRSCLVDLWWKTRTKWLENSCGHIPSSSAL